MRLSETEVSGRYMSRIKNNQTQQLWNEYHQIEQKDKEAQTIIIRPKNEREHEEKKIKIWNGLTATCVTYVNLKSKVRDPIRLVYLDTANRKTKVIFNINESWTVSSVPYDILLNSTLIWRYPTW